MANTALQCPNCGTDLTEALAKQLREDIRGEFAQKYLESKQQLEEQAQRKQQDLERKIEFERKRAEDIQRTTEEENRKRAQEFELRLKQEQERFQHDATAKAKEQLDVQLRTMQQQIEEQQERIRKQNDTEIELRKQQRALEEQREQLQLEVERRLSEERQRVHEAMEKQFIETYRLKDAEKEKKIEDMQKLIEDLQRKSQQGSQQTQGEVLELELESTLRQAFIHDDIKPVPKGVRGADVIHTVVTQLGVECGKIIWEFKRTKTWSNDYIPKLKDDMREAKADIAVIVSVTLPKNVERFSNVDGVWVCDIQSAIGLATALRQGLLDVARVRASAEGKNEKMELVYDYLSGNEFRQRITAIAETFAAMKQDLDKEKTAMMKLWAQREKQLERMITNNAKMFGELQGIIGNALPSIPTFELGE